MPKRPNHCVNPHITNEYGAIGILCVGTQTKCPVTRNLNLRRTTLHDPKPAPHPSSTTESVLVRGRPEP
eukprot:4076343-Amphidinium_carterae.1